MNKREIGAAYEEAAAVFLEKKGVRILERNFRCRQGEIDLIGRDGEYLVFFEVKSGKMRTPVCRRRKPSGPSSSGKSAGRHSIIYIGNTMEKAFRYGLT